MIKKFVEKFEASRTDLRKRLSEKHPDNYKQLFEYLVDILKDDTVYPEGPDPERITVIDEGDYQGTLVFIVGESGYQPSTYWATSVSYGSCSGCDTFQAIKDYSYDDTKPTEQQIDDYVNLVLHMVQRMRQICGYDESSY